MRSIIHKGDSMVIKVGSNILYGKDNGVNLDTIKNIVEGIDFLIGVGIRVFLVSSGAVAIGKNMLERNGYVFSQILSSDEQAFCASFGQSKLMQIYSQLFEEKNIIVSQMLLTHNNFENDESENLSKVFEQFTGRTIAIMNENDVVSREELQGSKFSDNDELSGLVAGKVKAKILILLSNIDGFYKDYGSEFSSLISDVYKDDLKSFKKYVSNEKSSMGKGGFASKIRVFEKIIPSNIVGILANGQTENVLQDIYDEKNIKKTVFWPK